MHTYLPADILDLRRINGLVRQPLINRLGTHLPQHLDNLICLLNPNYRISIRMYNICKLETPSLLDS
jgi:hypothetical protein